MLTITPEARAYALRELALRAGVELSLFDQWRIELQPSYTKLWVDERRFVQFPNAGSDFWREIADGNFRVANFAWILPAREGLSRLIPELIIPFADRDGCVPLFRIADEFHAECAVDLLSSIWLTLSRFEETLPGNRDAHGRFTATQSLAFKRRFLHRPVVNECGLAFEQVLRVLLPGWKPRARELRVKLSHDIDHVGVPLRLKPAIGHLLVRRNPKAAFRNISSKFTGLRPAELESVIRIVELAGNQGLHSAVYWKASTSGAFDSGYDPRAPKVQAVIADLRERDVELGVHPGYETFLNPEKLNQEVESLREALQQQELGGRQHYLRWSPATWQHWEMCGLKYDSSVGFADHVGFRAGTCSPYRPWLIDQNREANLLEIPLLVMDGTLTCYMQLDREKALSVALDCIDRCRAVGGVFTFLWHNDSLIQRKSRMLYQQILLELSGVKTYDWKSDLQIFRLQGVRQQRTREPLSTVAL